MHDNAHQLKSPALDADAHEAAADMRRKHAALRLATAAFKAIAERDRWTAEKIAAEFAYLNG